MKALGIWILLVVGIVAYYKYSYPSYTYRYKMTVEVDTPDGVKSGSSVIEVHTTQIPQWLKHIAGGQTKGSRAYGEAPFVDLGDKGILFTAFRGSYADRLYPRVYSGKGHAGWKPGGVPEYAIDKAFKKELDEENYPTLVYFEDLSDVKTMNVVKPNNIVKYFGDGFNLKSLKIEVTNEKPQKEVELVLPDFKKLSGLSTRERGLPFGITKTDFVGLKYDQ